MTSVLRFHWLSSCLSALVAVLGTVGALVVASPGSASATTYARNAWWITRPLGQTLRITPSRWAQVEGISAASGVMSNTIRIAGWPAYSNAVYKSMFEQLQCHLLVRLKTPYDLDTWRPSVSFATEVKDKCNPPPKESSSAPAPTTASTAPAPSPSPMPSTTSSPASGPATPAPAPTPTPTSGPTTTTPAPAAPSYAEATGDGPVHTWSSPDGPSGTAGPTLSADTVYLITCYTTGTPEGPGQDPYWYEVAGTSSFGSADSFCDEGASTCPGGFTGTPTVDTSVSRC
jgi:hypothetical protein